MYRALTGAMRKSLVSSAHDCSDGGLAVALAECCFGADSGATVELDNLEKLRHWISGGPVCRRACEY